MKIFEDFQKKDRSACLTARVELSSSVPMSDKCSPVTFYCRDHLSEWTQTHSLLQLVPSQAVGLSRTLKVKRTNTRELKNVLNSGTTAIFSMESFRTGFGCVFSAGWSPLARRGGFITLSVCLLWRWGSRKRWLSIQEAVLSCLRCWDFSAPVS